MRRRRYIRTSRRTSPTEIRLENIGPVTKPVEFVRPELHHRHALVPMFAARIGPADAVALQVRELSLNRIGIELPRLVEQGRRHSPEAVRRHLFRPEAEGAKGGVDGIFGHGPSRRTERRET